MMTMTITDRDAKVLSFIYAFKYATTPQIRTILFGANKSATPTKRALDRLLAGGLVKRAGRRAFGSDLNMTGAVPIIYTVTTRGRREAGGRDASPVQSGLAYIRHCLAVVDVLQIITEQARAGRFIVADFETEPDNRVKIGGVRLNPDLTLDIAKPDGSHWASLWIESDMDTQGKRQITEKLRKYITAYESTSEGTPWRQVIFVVPDEDRKRALQRIIRAHDAEMVALFDVVEGHAFMSVFDR